MHFLVPQGIDDRVEDWSDHCVEQGNNLGEELGMDSRGRNVQDHECSIKYGHHSQVRGACASLLLQPIACKIPAHLGVVCASRKCLVPVETRRGF